MNLTNDMKNKINEILDDRDFLRTGKKFVNGEEYRLSDAVLMTQIIRDKETELGKMIVNHFTNDCYSRFVVE